MKKYDDFKRMACTSNGIYEKVQTLGDYQKNVLQFTEFFQRNRLKIPFFRFRKMFSIRCTVLVMKSMSHLFTMFDVIIQYNYRIESEAETPMWSNVYFDQVIIVI